ncbi:MAG TPA: hypothetical protein VKE41_12070 [Roseiflexaceae bacterium]|nr:hypothetical protein [Roseiflexaceae bacterium]
MITSPNQQPTTYTTNESTIGKQALAVIRWPFTNRLSSPVWLALRLYIAWIWFQMGISKLQAGWLTSDPVGAMFKLIEKGSIAVPLPFYRGVASALLDAGVSPMISHSMPFLELAVALSLATGVLVPAAAVGAILLNINIILSGIGTPAFDGPIIASEVLFLMSYRVVGGIGFERLAGCILSAALNLVRPARKQAVVSSQKS